MANDRRTVRRSDLPANFTPESLRTVPINTLRRLRDPRNGVLSADEQADFNAALHQLMSTTAGRVSGHIGGGDWRRVWRDDRRGGLRGGPRPEQPEDRHLSRLARRVEQQVAVAESLAPDVDWSFVSRPDAPGADGAEARPDDPDPRAAPQAPSADGDTLASSAASQTIADLENQLTDELQLVQMVTEIAEMGRRTYALEQQRELSGTRSVFFGFAVSVAVIAAGWAPIVMAGAAERLWIGALTLVTCLAAGLVYVLVRRWQKAHPPETDGA